VLSEYADALTADVYAGVLLNYGTVLGLLGQKQRGRALLEDSIQRFTDLGLHKVQALGLRGKLNLFDKMAFDVFCRQIAAFFPSKL